jgi:cell division protein FtsB
MKRARLIVRPPSQRTGTERKNLPRSLTGRLGMLVAAVVLGWTVLAFAVQYVRTYALAREAVRLERYRQDLLVQNAALLGEIRRLRTDDQYIERLARQQLGMLRPGELELVIIPATPAKRHSERDPAPAATTQPAEPRDSARQLLQRIIETVRAAAERMLDRMRLAAP